MNKYFGIACKSCREFVAAPARDAGNGHIEIPLYSENPFADNCVSAFLSEHSGHLLTIGDGEQLYTDGLRRFVTLSVLSNAG